MSCGSILNGPFQSFPHMSSGKEVSRFFRHSAIYAIGNAMNRVGAFLLLPLYTRYLSSGQYGTLEIFYAISAVVSGVLSVGIAHATLRFYFDYKEDRDRHALVSTNLIASFVLSLVGVLVIASFGDHLVRWMLGEGAPTWALPIVLVTLVLELSSQVALAYLRAREQSILFIAVSFGKLVVQCIANAVLLTRFEAGITGVLGGNMLAVAVGWVVLVGYTLRQCGLRFELDKLMPVLRYSLPFLYITIIAAATANIDKFVINAVLSLEALGVYALALKFSKLISDLIGEPFNRAYGAFRFTIMNQPEAPLMQARILRYVAAMLAVVSLSLGYFTIDVLRLMATPQYWGAAQLMPMLVVAASLQMLCYILQTGILYNKSTHELVRITVVRTLVGLFVGIPLILWLGLQGACLSALLDSVVAAVMTHRISQRYFLVKYDNRRLAVLALLVVGFYGLALPMASWSPWVEFFGKLGLFVLFLAVLLRSPVLDATERVWLFSRALRLVALPRVR